MADEKERVMTNWKKRAKWTVIAVFVRRALAVMLHIEGKLREQKLDDVRQLEFFNKVLDVILDIEWLERKAELYSEGKF